MAKKTRLDRVQPLNKKDYWVPLTMSFLEVLVHPVTSKDLEKIKLHTPTWQHRAAYAEAQGWVMSRNVGEDTWLWQRTKQGKQALDRYLRKRAEAACAVIRDGV